MPLKVSDGIDAWIKDFKKSDAPQLKGKSEKERRDQAIAAYLSAKRGPQNEDYGAMKDAEAHAKRDGKNYNDVSVQHKYDAYHMKKRGYTHFTPSRYGGRTYHKGSAGYDSEKIEPHHYSGISEAWETIGRTPDGNYKIQRDTVTGNKRRVPNIKEEAPTGKQVKQAIGIARDPRYKGGNMTGAVNAMNKINPKLSDHPRVKDELQKHNESKAADRAALKKATSDYLRGGGKIKRYRARKADGWHGLNDPYKNVKGMLDPDDTKAVGTRKKVKSMGSALTMGEAKQTHVFNNEKDARAKAKEIGGKYVRGTGKSAGKHAAIKNEEFTFKVEVEGLPQMFMSGNSPGEVKSNLRKLIKQPSMLKSIDRVTKATLRKKRRAQMQMGEGLDETAKKKFIQDPKLKNLKMRNPRVKRSSSVDMYKGLNMSVDENRRERLRAKLAGVGKDMEKTNKELKKTVGIQDKPQQRLGSDGKPYKSKYFNPKDEGVMDTLKSVGSAVAGQFTGRQAKLTGNASKVKSASDMRKRGATPK